MAESDLTHRNLAERLTRLEERLGIKLEAIETQLSEAKTERERVYKRLLLLERSDAVRHAVDDAQNKSADLWRTRIYFVLRHFLPPGAAAMTAVWAADHWPLGS